MVSLESLKHSSVAGLGGNEETTAHIASESSKLAQLEYKRRHDKVAGAVHWSLCNKYSVQCSQQWYQHTAEPVIDKIGLLWDVNIQTEEI